MVTLAHNLITVKDCLTANIFETVDFEVKIITKSERKQPISINRQTKYQADCIVADMTGSTKLVLWEEVIDKIHSGKVITSKAKQFVSLMIKNLSTAMRQQLYQKLITYQMSI